MRMILLFVISFLLLSRRRLHRLKCPGRHAAHTTVICHSIALCMKEKRRILSLLTKLLPHHLNIYPVSHDRPGIFLPFFPQDAAFYGMLHHVAYRLVCIKRHVRGNDHIRESSEDIQVALAEHV